MSFSPSDPSASRRWLPAAIIGAAIVVAAGLVSAALIFSKGHAAEVNSSSGSDVSGSSTCQAWKTAQDVLRQIPALPAGYDWNTPNIDQLIANRNAATTGVLDQFTPEIAAQPPEVAEAARQYVAAKRREISTLADHTLTSADAAAGNDALGRLNRLCGLVA